MSAIRTALAASPFDFQPTWARTISGEEEGSFGWLAVNQLLNTISDSSQPLIGALDLGMTWWRTTKHAWICRLSSSLKSLSLSLAGGASTQVTFLPETDVLASFFPIVLPPAAGRSNLAGVFSHSYLHYGINEAVNRYADGIAA